MEYTVKKLPKSEVEIKATVSEEILKIAQKKAADEISKDIKVKGFRPGHVPPHILEQHIDKKYLTAYTQDLAIQKAYAEVVVKEKLQVVARPKVKIDTDEPLTFTATVAVMPEMEIKDYKSIKVKKEEPKVTKDDIEKVLDDMKKYGTVYKDVDRAAKKKDRVEVDFEGFDKDGKAVENTKSTNHPVIIGENSLIPGFEDELIGLKKGEKKEFDITFPKDYGKKDFQNRKLQFKVELKRVEEPSEPEINDDFVEKMTGKKQSVADFKKEIEENILAKKTEEAKIKQENEYVEALLKKAKVEIPEAMIDEETEFILQDMQEDIQRRGVEWAQFLERSGTNEDDLRKKYRSEGERRIKLRLALHFLIKEEKIEVTDKDLADELAKIKASYPDDQHAKIQEEFDGGKLALQLRNRLSLQKLFDRVL